MKSAVDVLIVGGGLVGASLAIALKDSGLTTALVEAKPFSELQDVNFDARSIALSGSSQKILDTLGLWQELKEHATAIDKIHVSEQGRFGATRINGEESSLGFVCELHAINRVLHKTLSAQQTTVMAPAMVTALDKNGAVINVDGKQQHIAAKIIVAADGANSSVRKMQALQATHHDYQQHAIVANIGLKRDHQNIAYERFTENGPIALLPMQDKRCALVWAVSPEKARELKSHSEEEFLAVLQVAFGYRLGRFIKCGKRFSFPLQSVVMPKQVKDNVVFIGNAAHFLHPIAGQGFNLGLRDVAVLAEVLMSGKSLNYYEKMRSRDQALTINFTHGLVRIFCQYFPLLGLTRSKALVALDLCQPAKNFLTRYAKGLGGRVPDLACGIAYEK